MRSNRTRSGHARVPCDGEGWMASSRDLGGIWAQVEGTPPNRIQSNSRVLRLDTAGAHRNPKPLYRPAQAGLFSFYLSFTHRPARFERAASPGT